MSEALRKRDKARRWVQRHSAYTRLAVGVGVGSGLVYALGSQLPYVDPVPAAITVVVASRATFHQATKESVFQILGALIGGALAVGIVAVLGANALTVGALVTLAYVVARVMRVASEEESPFVGMSLAVTVILVIGVGLDTGLAIERFGGVLLGSLVAVFVSVFASPAKQTRGLMDASESLRADTRDLLERVSLSLRAGAGQGERDGWFDEAVELRNRSLGVQAGVSELSRNRRWTLLVSREEISELQRSARVTDVSTARVLSMTADIKGGRGTVQLPDTVLGPLASLVQETKVNMSSDDPTANIGLDPIRQAMRAAEETGQIALVGGIVGHLQRINRAHAEEYGRDDEDQDLRM